MQAGFGPYRCHFSEYDIVQPDFIVVCDKKKITEDNIQGAPDLSIELLSRPTALKDKREKLLLYEQYKVLEYLIIDPVLEYVELYTLNDGHYGMPEKFGDGESVIISCVDNLEIRLSEIFER